MIFFLNKKELKKKLCVSDNMFRRKSIACGFLNGFLACNVMILWQNCICWSCRVRSFFLQSLFPGVWPFFVSGTDGLAIWVCCEDFCQTMLVYFGNVHSFNYVIISVFSSFFTIFAR